ncbi:hypothetical protein PMI36_05585 [Pseudomonas sp. GM79]|uniref:hypothetical protein n=1 Tax=Pseudomonas sp. GM79 TaxID=1144338 RepID=UPI00026F7CC4|nr:hypothetical protein [Pseudomonas sp. GM79]EJN17251.1 hypothetical protein PMI36_05585 [Pseudomonas sp. GM79]
MSELAKNVTSASPKKTNEEHYRAYAVAAALEVIAGYVASGLSVNLESEMESLSSYADKIQEALKVNAE